MESTKLSEKISQMEKAFQSFDLSLNLDLNQLGESYLDTLKNGQIQKFEYTLELVWKTIKAFHASKGLIFNYPKDCLRDFFPMTNLTEEEKILTLQMIDDRNNIAHEYKDYIMSVIYPKLTVYRELLRELINSFPK